VPSLLATAGGFGGRFDAHPGSYTLAPDAAPKLVVAALLVLMLVVWVRAAAR
jgi:hypothetical protein